MKTIVLYNSKTGFTKRYAEWLGEITGCTVMPFEKAVSLDLTPYGTVIFASWFHAGMIQKLGSFKKMNLNGKNRIVMVTGSNPPGLAETDTAIQNNFKSDGEKYKVFYLPGGLNYEKMGIGSKIMMAGFRKIIKKANGEDSEMYKRISHSYDNTSKEYLQPLVSYLNSL